MGRKLDMLLGKTNKYSSKVRALAKLALSRIPFLKKQHQSRLSQERSNVAELLRLGHRDRALLRVELVMRDQRMLDALVMIEGYCKVLVESAMLIEKHEKECPQELREVVSSLIFAASRCGELPELHEIRGVATKLYGKEFTAQAVELHSGCGVNPMITRRLSTRARSLDSRMEVLGEIASQNGIALQSANTNTETHPVAENEGQPELKSDINPLGDDGTSLPGQSFRDTDSSPEATDSGMAYQDAVVAAQDAFLSAAFSTAAARAAVKLSRMEIVPTL